MFTGIIQGLGIIQSINNLNQFYIKTELDISDCKIGSSLCCDGICLTITSIKKNKDKYLFSVKIGEETIKRSTAKFWKKNLIVNLEKSLKVGDEISGHFVYGHVDDIVKILKIKKLKQILNYYFSKLKFIKYKSFDKYVVEKGSICLNGISLTLANVDKDIFDVSIIQHTYDTTNLSKLKEGDFVNIEFDQIAKYINYKNV